MVLNKFLQQKSNIFNTTKFNAYKLITITIKMIYYISLKEGIEELLDTRNINKIKLSYQTPNLTESIAY